MLAFINFQFLSHQETERRLFDSLAELGAGPRIALGTSGYEPEMIVTNSNEKQ